MKKLLKRKRSTPAAPEVHVENWDPTWEDVKFHGRGADYWLRVAEQVGVGRSSAANREAAALSQAHAALGLLAYKIVSGRTVKHVNGSIGTTGNINETLRRAFRPRAFQPQDDPSC